MIERILYSNLDRRPDRNEWFLKNMEAAGVPMELVERVPAKDWRDYDSVEDTVKAMQKDGFALNVKGRHSILAPDFRGLIAYIFTASCMLKKVIDEGRMTLMIQDDCRLKSWEDLIDCLRPVSRFVENTGSHLQVCQLLYAQTLERNNICEPYGKDGVWEYGIKNAGDAAFICSFWGAEKILAIMQGGHTILNQIENILYLHFNNYRSIHPVDSARFMEFSRDLRNSDINFYQNPGGC